MTDFEVVQSQAKLNNLPVMLVFSGSDWCIWCQRLAAEVLDDPAFCQWKKDHVNVLMVDFPQYIPLNDEQRQQNENLARRFGIEGFPTVVLTDADGNELARTGYRRGGAASYIVHLEELLKK